MAKNFLRSVSIPHLKHTALMVPTRMNAPASVTLPMSMSIGAPAVPAVKAGDHVKVGQLVGEAQGFVSAPIYATVSGTVKRVDDFILSNGSLTKAVVIESDGLMENFEGITPPVLTDFDSFIQAVRDSGAVGLGGAGFPTAAKLKVDPARVDYILINGAECEPYITSDTHTMVDNAERIVWGVETLQRYYPGARIILGIEDNKPKAAELLQSRLSGIRNFTVDVLPSSYPQGGEKVLIYNTTGRIVPEGKLPIDVGCIVLNTTTVSLIGKYVKTGIPLVAKCVTVDGSAMKAPCNVIVPVGTAIRDVLEFVGGFRKEPKKVMYGGPMMGITIPDLDQPVLKSTNAIIALAEEEAVLPAPSACIHCGRCVDACPMELMPTEMEHARISGDVERLKKLKVNLCMECGSCAFVCPAKRNLVESHKLAKSMIRGK